MFFHETLLNIYIWPGGFARQMRPPSNCFNSPSENKIWSSDEAEGMTKWKKRNKIKSMMIGPCDTAIKYNKTLHTFMWTTMAGYYSPLYTRTIRTCVCLSIYCPSISLQEPDDNALVCPRQLAFTRQIGRCPASKLTANHRRPAGNTVSGTIHVRRTTNNQH